MTHTLLSCLGPGAAPDNVTAETSGLKSILVTWGKVMEEARNGKVEGYLIYYKERFTAEEEVVTLNVSEHKHELTDLKYSAYYNICVLAFTGEGEGPRGCVNQTTELLGKLIYEHTGNQRWAIE